MKITLTQSGLNIDGEFIAAGLLTAAGETLPTMDTWRTVTAMSDGRFIGVTESGEQRIVTSIALTTWLAGVRQRAAEIAQNVADYLAQPPTEPTPPQPTLEDQIAALQVVVMAQQFELTQANQTVAMLALQVAQEGTI